MCIASLKENVERPSVFRVLGSSIRAPSFTIPVKSEWQISCHPNMQILILILIFLLAPSLDLQHANPNRLFQPSHLLGHLRKKSQ